MLYVDLITVLDPRRENDEFPPCGNSVESCSVWSIAKLADQDSRQRTAEQAIPSTLSMASLLDTL